jgi:branched-chain amino acid transport system substrate-binding protein
VGELGAIVLLVGLMATLTGCGPSRSQEQNQIRIGAIFPLTGPGALWGQNSQRGVDLAAEQLRAEGKVIRIFYQDSKADPATGVSELRQLMDFNHIQGLIDDAASSVALAEVPIATQHELPMISTGSSNPKLSGSSPYFMRLWNSDAEEATVSARFIRSNLHLQRGAILYIQNEYGEGLKDAFSKQFEALGGAIQDKVPFSQDAVDFRNAIIKVMDGKPEFVYLVAYPNNFPSLIPQLNRGRGAIPVIGTAALNDPAMLGQLGSQADHIYFPSAQQPPDSQVREDFLAAFKKKYGTEPGAPAAEGYDALRLMVMALDSSKGNGTSAVKFLHSRSFDGASGVIQFDANGDVHKPMDMYEVKQGKAAVVQKAKP